jgi:hypothetical protein
MSDEARWIGRAHGYTGSPAHAADRLEALSEDAQQEMTAASHRRALDERIRSRQATAEEVRAEIQHLEGRLRFLGRQLRRLSRA